MKTMKLGTACAAALAITLLAPMPSQAGVIEDLLAVPAIQSLLNRQPELQAMVQRCAESGYNRRNATLCQQGDAAIRLSRLPPELRVLMSNRAAATSIRELCLAAQPTPAQNSYLCAELSKADINFRNLMQQGNPLAPPGGVAPAESGHS